jgi:hypothetical protein
MKYPMDLIKLCTFCWNDTFDIDKCKNCYPSVITDEERPLIYYKHYPILYISKEKIKKLCIREIQRKFYNGETIE